MGAGLHPIESYFLLLLYCFPLLVFRTEMTATPSASKFLELATAKCSVSSAYMAECWAKMSEGTALETKFGILLYAARDN